MRTHKHRIDTNILIMQQTIEEETIELEELHEHRQFVIKKIMFNSPYGRHRK